MPSGFDQSSDNPIEPSESIAEDVTTRLHSESSPVQTVPVSPDSLAFDSEMMPEESANETDSEPSSIEDVVASAPLPAREPPSAFLRLKAYCDEHGLKCTLDLGEPVDTVNLELKNGRTVRNVLIASEEGAESLLSCSLQDLVFLGEYAAVCSYKEGWIEAAVRSHGIGPRALIVRRNIFGLRPMTSKEPLEKEIAGAGGVVLRLTEKRGILSFFDYTSPVYLRIEGIGITEHDKATNLLEDLSNSLFRQIDFKFDSPLTLVRDRFSARRILRSRGRLDEDNELVYPRFSYERSPSSLYWYARSAQSMPLLQFLAFYQCIEFFFPQYSRQETIAKIKNVIKDPAFDATKDSYVNSILNVTLEGRRGSLVEERKQLGATLRHCVDAISLRDFLNDTDVRKRYYASEYKKISEKKIALTDDVGLIDQTADRIYDIRCKVVHTKSSDGPDGIEMILPFSREADLLTDDVELIKFLARKVLIASSAPLRI
jgi:hypothetical protein